VVFIRSIILEERAERRLAILVYNGTVGSVVKNIVCNDRISALNLKAKPVFY
jgi:hypothetical protein